MGNIYELLVYFSCSFSKLFVIIEFHVELLLHVGGKKGD